MFGIALFQIARINVLFHRHCLTAVQFLLDLSFLCLKAVIINPYSSFFSMTPVFSIYNHDQDSISQLTIFVLC